MEIRKFIKRVLGLADRHRDFAAADTETSGHVVIVGSPNVGKSVIFNRLAGMYVTVSNYPGTTIECDHGTTTIGGRSYHVIDTPGTYSLLPISQEERLARKILIEQKPDVVIHVVDAKNLSRMLCLTAQLLEAGLPTILVLNMMDEARELGIRIDTRKLEKILSIPVIPTVAVTGEGLDELKRRITEKQLTADFTVAYSERAQRGLDAISAAIDNPSHFRDRFLALMLLQGDKYFADFGVAGDARAHDEARRINREQGGDFALALCQQRRRALDRIVSQVYQRGQLTRRRITQALDYISLHPVWGTLILLFILYFGLYQFVGVFGAGTLVDLLENGVFGHYISPFSIAAADVIFPFPHYHIVVDGAITTDYTVTADLSLWQSGLRLLHDLLVGEYGIITLGLSYAIAIVLPIVTLYFFLFSLLEDSGYLPRLAAILDTLCKRIGLNGRAVIPLVLGLGCGTMATLTTRILETRRERLIAIFLLALTIPCSAQLGVIIGILGEHGHALVIWAGILITIFAAAGVLLDRLMPGRKQSFYLEIPPLRLPKLSNILLKTYARLKMYLVEVVPLFVLASVLIWLGKLLYVFDLAVALLQRLVALIGLPGETAEIFLFGFFRRDYGAAGLYELNNQGVLSVRELIVTAVILTLFVPCVAQFLIMKKELGAKIAFGISSAIFITAFIIGWLANIGLAVVGMV